MEALLAFIIVAIIATVIYYTLKVSLLVLRALWQLGSPMPGAGRPGIHSLNARHSLEDDSDGMNPGDYYNGPGGYDATGGYIDRHRDR